MSDQEIENQSFDYVNLHLPFQMLGWSLHPKEWSGIECETLLHPSKDSVASKLAIDVKEHLIGMINRNDLKLQCWIDGGWQEYEEVMNKLIIQKMNVLDSLIHNKHGGNVACRVPEADLILRIEDYLRKMTRSKAGPKREFLKFDVVLLEYFCNLKNINAEREDVINHINKTTLAVNDIPGETTYNKRIDQIQGVATNILKIYQNQSGEKETVDNFLNHLKKISKIHLDN